MTRYSPAPPSTAGSLPVKRPSNVCRAALGSVVTCFGYAAAMRRSVSGGTCVSFGSSNFDIRRSRQAVIRRTSAPSSGCISIA